MANNEDEKLKKLRPLACHIAAQLPTNRDEADEILKMLNEILDLFSADDGPDPKKPVLRLVE